MNSPTLTKTHYSANYATKLLTNSYLLQDTPKCVSLALSQAVLIDKIYQRASNVMKELPITWMG